MDDQHDMVTSTLTWFHTRIEVSKETPREKKTDSLLWFITDFHHPDIFVPLSAPTLTTWKLLVIICSSCGNERSQPQQNSVFQNTPIELKFHQNWAYNQLSHVFLTIFDGNVQIKSVWFLLGHHHLRIPSRYDGKEPEDAKPFVRVAYAYISKIQNMRHWHVLTADFFPTKQNIYHFCPSLWANRTVLAPSSRCVPGAKQWWVRSRQFHHHLVKLPPFGCCFQPLRNQKMVVT